MFVVPPLGGPGGGPQYHFRKFSGSDIGAVGRFAGTTTLRKNSAGSAPAIRRLPNRPFFLTEGQRLHSNEPAGPKDLARRSFEKGRSQAGAWEREKVVERPAVDEDLEMCHFRARGLVFSNFSVATIRARNILSQHELRRQHAMLLAVRI